jgi:hypothetical protein
MNSLITESNQFLSLISCTYELSMYVDYTLVEGGVSGLGDPLSFTRNFYP